MDGAVKVEPPASSPTLASPPLSNPPPAAPEDKKGEDSDEDVPLAQKMKKTIPKHIPKKPSAAPKRKAPEPSSSSSLPAAPAKAAEPKPDGSAPKKQKVDDNDNKSTPNAEGKTVDAPKAKKGKAQVLKKEKPPKPPPKPKPAAKPKPTPKKEEPKKESKKESKKDEESEKEEEEDDDDKPIAKKQKTANGAKKKPEKKEKDPKPKGASKSSKSDAKKAAAMEKTRHSADKYEARAPCPLMPVKGANKWWDRPRDAKIKWETLEHNAVIFPPPYEAHNVKMKYDGKEVELTPEQEEVATMYAAMLESDYVKKPKFNVNFFRDWSKLLGKDHAIKELKKCDFSPIHRHLVAEKERKKEEKKQPEMKKKLKEEKESLLNTFGFALVDGYREKVGNFRVEPPGLFRGRGEHPKSGTLKRRVRPEEITINIGMGVPIPKAPEGHQWKGVVHNNTVTWLAFWLDNVNGDFKYVFLASSSRFKGESDMQKYTKAQKLKDYIEKIRKSYNQHLHSKHEVEKQRATAIYLIDKLALRVGNEKDKSEVADTVGCCSLRVEHLKFFEDFQVEFDFLGKDSMRYYNKVQLEEIVYNNLKHFTDKKKPTSTIFDRLTTQSLNDHLKTLMPGLTAKVFRTYNASVTLQKELREVEEEKDIDLSALVSEKVLYYNRANKTVAVLCNHQRSVPKGFEGQREKLQLKILELKDKKEQLQDHIDELTGKKKKGSKVKKEKVKKEKKEGDPEEKEFKMSDDPDKARDQLARIETQLANQEAKAQLKDDTKTVALGTSKINYMDPRITIAWCKAKEMPLEKIFNKSLLDKFPWAMEVPSSWRF